jgi:hypothetical protein
MLLRRLMLLNGELHSSRKRGPQSTFRFSSSPLPMEKSPAFPVERLLCFFEFELVQALELHALRQRE